MPEAAAIRSEIQRVLSSPGFENSERMKQFLLYITEKALTGNADELKEYAIGVDVFRRGEGFDPKIDSIVRVTAGKLRLKLKEYYLTNPKAPIQIELPAGSYVPMFVEQQKSSAPATAVVVGSSKAIRLTLLVVAVLLAGGLAATFSLRTESRRTLRKVTSETAVSRDAAISRDGKLLAYVSNREGSRFQLYVEQLAGGPPLRFPEITGNAQSPDFSPDGSKIVFVGSAVAQDSITPAGSAQLAASKGIYVIPIFGKTPVRIADGDANPHFSPDGKWILFSRGIGRIFVVPATGGTGKQVSPENFALATNGIFTPDGKHVLFFGRPQGVSDQQRDWWVVSIDDGELTQTGVKEVFRTTERQTELDQFYCFPSAWLGGQVLGWCDFKQRSNLYTTPILTTRWKVAGPMERLTFGSEGHEHNPSASDSGRIVFSSNLRSVDIFEQQGDATTGSFENREPRQVTSHGADLHHITLASNGERMSYDIARGNVEVWRRDLLNGREELLASGRVFRAVISPNGQMVAYHEPRDNGSRIVVAPFEGGENIFSCTGCQLPQGWTPDNRKVIWSYYNYYGLVTTDVSSGAQETWIDRKRSVQAGGISSDGGWLSLSTLGMDGAKPAGYAVPIRNGKPAPESEWVRVRSGASQMQWSPDGNMLYFLSSEDGYLCLYGQKLDPITKHPRGTPIGAYHLHSSDRSLFGSWMIPFNFAVTKAKLYLTVIRAQSNIWALE